MKSKIRISLKMKLCFFALTLLFNGCVKTEAEIVSFGMWQKCDNELINIIIISGMTIFALACK